MPTAGALVQNHRQTYREFAPCFAPIDGIFAVVGFENNQLGIPSAHVRSCSTDIHRGSAWSRRGDKVEGWVSGRRFERPGLVARQRQNEIPAPTQYPGTMDAELFEAWFSAMLPPQIGAGRLIVMDSAYPPRSPRRFPPQGPAV